MPTAYNSAQEHVDEELSRVALMLQKQMYLHWEQGLLPRMKDEFSGTFVSGGEVEALLSGGRPLSPEAEGRLAELDAALEAYGERIEDRLKEAQRQGDPLPWDQLRRAFRLSPTEEQVLWLLIAVETCSRHRQLVRYLMNDAARVNSDLGLLELCVYSTPLLSTPHLSAPLHGTPHFNAPQRRERMIDELSADGPLLRFRLVEPVGGKRAADDLPFLLRPIRVAPRIIEWVHGRAALDREVAQFARLRQPRAPREWIGATVAGDHVRALLREAAHAGDRGEAAPVVVLVGPSGSGKHALIESAAWDLGTPILDVQASLLPEDREDFLRLSRALLRETMLLRATLVLTEIEPLLSDPRGRLFLLDQVLTDLPGPVAATMGAREARVPSLQRGVVRLDMVLPTETERSALWQGALSALPNTGLAPGFSVERVAARYPVTGGLIERAAAGAAAASGARRQGDVLLLSEADIHAGLRTVLDEKMTTLGTRITRHQRWEDLVVPQETHDRIQEFLARLQFRRQVYEQWGFARKLGKGLGTSALFSGPPGTGKTMVAGLIAQELGLDLYQIDLSRVVSKWIGETEKNLGQLFEAAEAGHAILLFDEADALFGKRTADVKSSVDRYANMEVNYLLQRIEHFDGITILTTNLESSIDQAFKRRLSFRLEFPVPDIEERRQLWSTMLPDEARVREVLDFAELARKYEMSGGNIRNATLRAGFLAASDRSEGIAMEHLRRAADLEYAAMGKVFSSPRPGRP